MEWQEHLLDNPLYFGIFFIFGWILVSFTFAIFTGWHKLAEQYRTYEKPGVKLLQAVHVTWGSSLMAGTIYTLGSTYKGLYLGVLFPFRIGHPPLLIPWRDISAKKVKRLVVSKIQLEFKYGLSKPFEISENVAEKLKAGSNGQLSF